MKKNKLLYFTAAAVIVYLIARKKTPAKTTTETIKEAAKNIIDEAHSKAAEIIDVIPIVTSPPQFLPSPAQVDTDFGIMSQNESGPIKITQSELVTTPQLSPTPASILSPEQLTKFNMINLPKGQLMGVC